MKLCDFSQDEFIPHENSEDHDNAIALSYLKSISRDCLWEMMLRVLTKPIAIVDGILIQELH